MDFHEHAAILAEKMAALDKRVAALEEAMTAMVSAANPVKAPPEAEEKDDDGD
jgi:hypothetical protein